MILRQSPLIQADSMFFSDAFLCIPVWGGLFRNHSVGYLAVTAESSLMVQLIHGPLFDGMVFVVERSISDC